MVSGTASLRIVATEEDAAALTPCGVTASIRSKSMRHRCRTEGRRMRALHGFRRRRAGVREGAHLLEHLNCIRRRVRTKALARWHVPEAPDRRERSRGLYCRHRLPCSVRRQRERYHDEVSAREQHRCLHPTSLRATALLKVGRPDSRADSAAARPLLPPRTLLQN